MRFWILIFLLSYLSLIGQCEEWLTELGWEEYEKVDVYALKLHHSELKGVFSESEIKLIIEYVEIFAPLNDLYELKSVPQLKLIFDRIECFCYLGKYRELYQFYGMKLDQYWSLNSMYNPWKLKLYSRHWNFDYRSNFLDAFLVNYKGSNFNLFYGDIRTSFGQGLSYSNRAYFKSRYFPSSFRSYHQNISINPYFSNDLYRKVVFLNVFNKVFKISYLNDLSKVVLRDGVFSLNYSYKDLKIGGVLRLDTLQELYFGLNYDVFLKGRNRLFGAFSWHDFKLNNLVQFELVLGDDFKSFHHYRQSQFSYDNETKPSLFRSIHPEEAFYHALDWQKGRFRAFIYREDYRSSRRIEQRDVFQWNVKRGLDLSYGFNDVNIGYRRSIYDDDMKEYLDRYSFNLRINYNSKIMFIYYVNKELYLINTCFKLSFNSKLNHALRFQLDYVKDDGSNSYFSPISMYRVNALTNVSMIDESNIGIWRFKLYSRYKQLSAVLSIHCNTEDYGLFMSLKYHLFFIRKNDL